MMFTVTDLVPNALLDLSKAQAINPSGVVVGTEVGSGSGFIWTPNQPNGKVGPNSPFPPTYLLEFVQYLMRLL